MIDPRCNPDGIDWDSSPMSPCGLAKICGSPVSDYLRDNSNPSDPKYYTHADIPPGFPVDPVVYSGRVNPDTFWSDFTIAYPNGHYIHTNWPAPDGQCACPSPTGDENAGSGSGEASTIDLSNEVVPDFRVRHSPTASSYLKVWIFKQFTQNDGTITKTDLAPYEWTGTGGENGTCLKISKREPSDVRNLVNSAPISFSRSTYGRNIIQVKKYSFVKGYEPEMIDEGGDEFDDGNYLNGWPPPG